MTVRIEDLSKELLARRLAEKGGLSGLVSFIRIAHDLLRLVLPMQTALFTDNELSPLSQRGLFAHKHRVVSFYLTTLFNRRLPEMSFLRKLLFTFCIAAMLAVTQPPSSASAQSTCDSQHKCNCVLWVRCARVPKLPYGLNTLQDKKNIINNYTPTVGSVAIMNIGAYGHVAYVAAVNKDSRGNVTSIKVEEANYKPCQVGSRTGSPSTMKVVGYFRP